MFITHIIISHVVFSRMVKSLKSARLLASWNAAVPPMDRGPLGDFKYASKNFSSIIFVSEGHFGMGCSSSGFWSSPRVAVVNSL